MDKHTSQHDFVICQRLKSSLERFKSKQRVRGHMVSQGLSVVVKSSQRLTSDQHPEVFSSRIFC